MGAILGSITFTAVVTFWVLASASKIRDVLGETAFASWCASGLLLVALAMRYFVNGIKYLWMIPRH
jgi:small neutral amino acid transporter SnatA (MarC family)